MEPIKNNNVLKDKSRDRADITNDFITIASHQLRTPITAVRWGLDNVLSGKLGELNDKQRHAIKLAYHNNLFLGRLVNDILRFSRLEERGLSLTPKPVDLKILIEKILKKYQHFAFASNCQVDFKPLAGRNTVFVDPLYFKSIIDSLINNAIVYSQLKGRVKITIKEAKDFLQLQIADSGIGIPPDQQQMVFTKFFRAKNAMKTQAGGLGLNLYIAKKICESSGGKITFSSRQNLGTVFTLYLPTKRSIAIQKSNFHEETPSELLKKEREFVNITIHELKAPLGVSKWSLEMLMHDKASNLTKEQRELLSRVYHGNERLLVLVRDLLNLAKLQEGKFPINPKPFEIISLTDEIVTGFIPEAKKKKIKLNWQKPKAKLILKNSDPDRIAQVITNLLSNAIKYTPQNGQVFVQLKQVSSEKIQEISKSTELVKLTNTKNKNGYLIFSFKDTGIGISKDDQKKLFSRFFRSSKVLESKTEGTGLGLFITKSIVSLHRGDIWFESEPNVGSTFYFSLPIN